MLSLGLRLGLILGAEAGIQSWTEAGVKPRTEAGVESRAEAGVRTWGCTVKKCFAVFPSPDGMSLTKLFLDGNTFPLLSLKFSLSQAGILTESF